MDDILKAVENLEGEMVAALSNMCRIPAIAPDSDGDGEAKRASFLVDLLKENGITDIEVYKAEDRRVSAGYRPNIVATIEGSEPDLPPLWMISHMDVVPTGDLGKWDTEPFNPIQKDGKLFGRGVEDNGQALIASLYAVKAILDKGMKPKRTVKLAFVADEEVGSKYGIQYLVKQKLFTPDDLLLVPDYGLPDGSVIEVVEKSHLQLKVITKGKQVHASRPNKGINAFRVASTFIDRVSNELYEHYANEDPMFGPPISTFEATKREANVPNINTIPGDDVFYMDCRILPREDLNEILEFMKNVATRIEIETGASIDIIEISSSIAPPATPIDSSIVVNLQSAIKTVMGVDAKPVGIGGGTCAAIFREAGYPAAVWSTNEEMAHEPNEYIKIENLISDAKVFALLCLM